MLFQEERKIVRGVSYGKTDKVWYVADDGRGGMERELRLWWLRACRGVLRPLSVHPASCWTWAQGE